MRFLPNYKFPKKFELIGIATITFLFGITIHFLSKKFSVVNFDTSIFIEYFWRINHGQVPHVDFYSPFGPFVYYLYYQFIFVANIFNPNNIFEHTNIINFLDTFKVTITFFVITYLYFLERLFPLKIKSNTIFLIVSIFISSFFISPRAYGYDYLIALTSFYNMVIEGSVILTIYTFLRASLFLMEEKRKKKFSYGIFFLILGVFNFQLILLKVTALILAFPILFIPFINKNQELKQLTFYYIIGLLIGLLFCFFTFGHNLLISYFFDVITAIKIRLDSSLIGTSLYERLPSIFLNVARDLFFLTLIFFVTEFAKNRNTLHKNRYSFYILFYLIIFLISFSLQLFSEQYPESNLASFMMIISFFVIFTSNIKPLYKGTLSLLFLAFPLWTIFKNILYPLLIITFSIFPNQNQSLNFLDNVFIKDLSIIKSINNSLDYSQVSFKEKIFKLDDKKIYRIIQKLEVLDIDKSVSSYMCHFPAAYIFDSVPPRNTNLYWHYGVTYGDSHNIFHDDDKTSVFIICNYYPGLYQQLNIKDFFEEIYVSDSRRVLVLKENIV